MTSTFGLFRVEEVLPPLADYCLTLCPPLSAATASKHDNGAERPDWPNLACAALRWRWACREIFVQRLEVAQKSWGQVGCKFQPTSPRLQLFAVLFCGSLTKPFAGARDPFFLPFPRCVSLTIAPVPGSLFGLRDKLLVCLATSRAVQLVRQKAVCKRWERGQRLFKCKTSDWVSNKVVGLTSVCLIRKQKNPWKPLISSLSRWLIVKMRNLTEAAWRPKVSAMVCD